MSQQCTFCGERATHELKFTRLSDSPWYTLCDRHLRESRSMAVMDEAQFEVRPLHPITPDNRGQ
jgi:hypothetical protein